MSTSSTEPRAAPSTAPATKGANSDHTMWRSPNSVRVRLLKICTIPCTGMMAKVGISPGITEMSRMPPPRPTTAAVVEATKVTRMRKSSDTVVPAGVQGPAGPCSRTTGLRSVPMWLISTATTSPSFMFSVAPSVPIHSTSPGTRVR